MRKIRLNRAISILLLIMMICTQTVSFLPERVFAAGTSEAVDRTSDRDELGIEIKNVKAYVGSTPKSIESQKLGDVTSFDFSSINPDVIDKVTFDLDFSVLKKSYSPSGNEDEIRQLKGGDYFTLDLGKGGMKVGDIPAKDILSKDNKRIASYEVSNNILKVTFSDEVNATNAAENIKGTVSLGVGLDLDKFSSKNDTNLDIISNSDTDKVTFKFGKLTDELSGVKVSGKLIPENSTILWTVSAATNNTGANLNGANLRVNFDPVKLSYKEAYVLIDGEKVYVDLCKESASGEYTYKILSDTTSKSGAKINLDTKAPFKLYVVTDIDSGALKSDFSESKNTDSEGNTVYSDVVRELSAHFEQGDMNLTVDPSNPANVDTGSVSLPRPHIAKQGEQINGNEMLWTLKVNDTDPQYVILDASIEDVFSGMDYVDGSFTIDGKKVENGKSADGTLTVTTDSGETTLTYAWPGNGKISSVHTITYKTKIDTTNNYDNKEVKNRVSMHGTWPTGNGGTGAKINYGMPTVTEEFQYVFISETASAVKNNDKANGLVKWEIKPSSRDDNWSNAKITVTNKDQKGVKGNKTYPVSLTYKGTVIGEKELEEKGYLSWDESNLPIFNLPHDKFPSLDKVTLNYYTSNPVFFKTNGVDVVSEGTSKVELTSKDISSSLTADTSAKAIIKNEILSLTSTLYYGKNSLEPEIEYTLTVNSNGVNIKEGTVVTENVNSLVATLVSGTINTQIPADSFEIVKDSVKVSSSDVIEDDTTGNIVLTYNKNSSDKYTLKFRIKLKNEAAKKYLLHPEGGVGGNIAVMNSASIEGTSLDGVENDVLVTVTDNDGLKNPQIDNSFIYKNSHVTSEYIEWTININQNGTLLNNAKIVDVIAKNLQLDYESIELYKATHDGSKLSLVALDKVNNFTKILNPSDVGSLELTVGLPDGNDAYILKYKTRLTEAVASVTNTARFENGNNIEESKSVCAIDDSATGFLTTVSHFKLKKMDSINHASLKDVLFGLYSVENGVAKMVAGPAFSDKNGCVSFYAVPSDAKNLTVREIRGIDDYETVDPEESVLGISSFKRGMNDLTATDGKIYNTRTKKGTFTFKKTYENADEDKSKDYVSKFTLFIKGESDKLIPVYLKKDTSGNLLYAQGKTEGLPTSVGMIQNMADEEGASSTFEIKGTNSVTFKNLPWGDYVIRELETKSGYSLASDSKFSVEKDGTIVAVNNLDVNDNSLLNKQIKLNLKKISEDNISLDGCVLAIYKNLTDARNGSDENIVVDPRDNKTPLVFIANGGSGDFSDSDQSDSIAMFSIPQLPGFTVENGKRTDEATYYLAEKQAPNDKRLSVINPIKIVVDSKGNVKYGDKLTLVGDDRTITVIDKTVKSRFVKEDQFKNKVSGATISLQRKNGTSWEDVTDSTFVSSKDVNDFLLEREGEYRLVETKLPEGYKSAAKIDDEGIYSKIVFKTDKFGAITVIDDGNNAAIKNTTVPYLKGYLNSYDKVTNTFVLKNEKIVANASFIKYSKSKDASGKNIAFSEANASFVLMECDDIEKTNPREVLLNGKSLKFKTDSKGLVSTKSVKDFYLERGHYFFREIENSDDFVLGSDTDSDVFTVDDKNRLTYDDDGNLTADIKVTKDNGEWTNEPLNACVVVNKKDVDGNVISGVTFSLKKITDEESKSEKTFSSDGKVTFKDSNGYSNELAVKKGSVAFTNLTAGKYILKEEIPAEGFKRDTTSHEIEVFKDGTMTLDGTSISKDGEFRIASIDVVNEKNSFSVTKKREDSSEVSLKGTKFGLFDKALNKLSEKTITTSDEGLIKFSGLIVPVKDALKDDSHTYIVREISPADGYTVALDTYVRMNYEGELFASYDKTNYEKVPDNNLTVINKLNSISFVMKDRETKEAIAGNSNDWELAITPKEGSRFADKTKAAKFIDSNTSSFKGILVPGNVYEVREITNPLGYLPFEEVSTLTVDNDGVVSISSNDDVFSVKNNEITVLNDKNELRIVKTGVKGHSVDGTEFSLKPVDDTFVDGSSAPLTFRMTESDSENLAVSDIYVGFKGNLKAGVVYCLEETHCADTYTPCDNLYIMISESGKIMVSNSSDGAFSEALYNVNGEGKNIVEVKNTSNSIEFTTYVNAYEYGKEETHVILPNATFTVYSKYENGELSNPVKCVSTNDKGEVVTDENGKIVIEGLKPGRYYIKQTEVPVFEPGVNRLIAEEKENLIAKFTVEENGKVSPLYSLDGENEFTSYLNDTVRASFHMTKVDALNNSTVLPDSEYVLYRKEKDIKVCESYKSGVTKKSFNMLHANHTGVRIAPVFGFLATAGVPGSVSIFGDDTVDFNEDEYTEVMRVMTGADGSISLDGLLTGYDYVLKEAVAPTGSQVSKEPIQFTFDIDRAGVIKTSLISGNGTVQKVEGAKNLNVLWKEPPTVVSIDKKTEAGGFLKGATLRIEDMRGKVIVPDFVTDGSSYEIKGVLKAGQKYKLVEVKAPKGYDIAPSITFTVKEKAVGSSERDIDNAKTVVTMIDKTTRPVKNVGVKKWIQKLFKSPKTGVNANVFVLLALVLCIVGSAIGFAITLNKKIK